MLENTKQQAALGSVVILNSEVAHKNHKIVKSVALNRALKIASFYILSEERMSTSIVQTLQVPVVWIIN